MDSAFISEVEYYTLPKGYPLYKASRESKDSMELAPGKFYFFGVKNDNPDYIKAYEENYGIIFEFETTREYKLLAMDTPKTLKTLYKSASPEIRKILKTNYGYRTGIRDSNSEQDRKLSAYICELGFDGYAIYTMKTLAGGTFHSEFMICKMSNIEFVGRVSNETSADNILAKEKLNKHTREMREKRRKIKSRKSPGTREVRISSSTPTSSNSKKKYRVDSPSVSNKSLEYSSLMQNLFDQPLEKNLFGDSPTHSSKYPLKQKLFDSPIGSPETPTSPSRKTKKREYVPTTET